MALFSKRSLEGYLLSENFNNLGVPDELILAARKAGKDLDFCNGKKLESATVTCSHCQTIVVLRPDRSRPRNYCGKCDHYVCDKFECNRECIPLNKVLDDLQEQAFQLIGKEEDKTHGVSLF